MGCSNSDAYESKVQTPKQTINSNPSQNPTNQNKPNPKPNPEDYSSIDFKVPSENFFELNPDFFKDINDAVDKSYSYGEYHGQIKDGLRNGKGRITWTVGDSKGNIYEGEWKDNAMHGKGLYIFTNGRRYKGDWYEGDMHGQGLMKYPNGIYTGSWVHDKREGIGKFLYIEDEVNGDIYAGQWKDDKRNGQAFYKQHKGYIFLTNWKDDRVDGEWTLLQKPETTENEEKNDESDSESDGGYVKGNNNHSQKSEKKMKGGQFLDKYGFPDGTMDDNGELRDKFGNPIGRIGSNGEIKDKFLNPFGTIGSNGEVRDKFGNPIGNAGRIDLKAAAARFFFFFNDEM